MADLFQFRKSLKCLIHNSEKSKWPIFETVENDK